MHISMTQRTSKLELLDDLGIQKNNERNKDVHSTLTRWLISLDPATWLGNTQVPLVVPAVGQGLVGRTLIGSLHWWGSIQHGETVHDLCCIVLAEKRACYPCTHPSTPRWVSFT